MLQHRTPPIHDRIAGALPQGTLYNNAGLHTSPSPCGRKCAKNGHKHEEESTWRAPDLNGVPVLIKYRPQRVKCPECGALNEWVPWADGESRFTQDFNNEVAWLAGRMSKSAIATFLGIDWRTVGNCVKAAHDRLEPDVEDRVHCGLRRICVDEL